jgi:large subunit ribosomal protein L5|tara:strand:- start:561 stop:1313 length:753 start_codon:yes stop_codon:yes gene_type:complete
MTEEQKTGAKASNTKSKKTAAKKPVAKKAAVKDSSTRKPKTPKNAKTAAVAKLKSKTSVIQTQVPRMKQVYIEEVSQVLVREFGYENPMEVPRIVKIVLNIGLGEALESNSAVGAAVGDLQKISGQKPIENRAKMSIANFKLREGSVIGTSVTLRGNRMWQFYDRFVNITLPRVRDFRGISRTAFDGRGNYSLGLRDQSTFPEIDYNEIDRMRGMQLTFVTSARSDEEGRRLLELLGMPFARVDEPVGAL